MDPYPALPPPPPGGKPDVEEAEAQAQAPSSSASPVKAVVVVAGLMLSLGGVVAAGIWWLSAPGVCDTSTVDSARFGYCVAAPGWQLSSGTTESQLPYDELIKPADAATVRIVAIELPAGQGLDFVVEQARTIASEDGLQLTEVVERRVAGVPAAQWDVVLEDGQVSQLVREVVFVREGSAWRVQLQADSEGFAVRAQEFEDILRTWTFR